MRIGADPMFEFEVAIRQERVSLFVVVGVLHFIRVSIIVAKVTIVTYVVNWFLRYFYSST